MPSFWTKRIEVPWLRPLIASCIGVLAVTWGVIGLGTGYGMAAVSSVKAAEYVFHIMGVIWGVLICVATWLRYRGGLWFAIGTLLVGGALVGTVSIVETHLRGWRFESPIAFYARIAACWIVGVAFLVMGHRRHRRKQQARPPMTQELKKLKIVVLIGTAFLCVLAFIPLLGHEWRISHLVARPSVIPANAWKKFSSPEGKFSIWFPGIPKTTNITISVSNTDISEPLFFVWFDQTEYAVNYGDWRGKRGKLEPEQVFDLYQKGVAADVGKVVYQRDTEFENYPGREFEYVVTGKVNYSGRVRLVLVGDRLYQMVVIFLPVNPHPADQKIFFNSFRLQD